MSKQADSLLRGANRDVAIRGVGQQRYGYVVVVKDRRIERGFGRFNCPAEAAPEIELPGQIEAECPLVEEIVADAEFAGRSRWRVCNCGKNLPLAMPSCACAAMMR